MIYDRCSFLIHLKTNLRCQFSQNISRIGATSNKYITCSKRDLCPVKSYIHYIIKSHTNFVHLPPPSINSVIVSTLSDPPNSSTEGAKIIRCSYKNSPYFESTRLASSADLKVSEYPLSANQMKTGLINIQLLTLLLGGVNKLQIILSHKTNYSVGENSLPFLTFLLIVLAAKCIIVNGHNLFAVKPRSKIEYVIQVLI